MAAPRWARGWDTIHHAVFFRRWNRFFGRCPFFIFSHHPHGVRSRPSVSALQPSDPIKASGLSLSCTSSHPQSTSCSFLLPWGRSLHLLASHPRALFTSRPSVTSFLPTNLLSFVALCMAPWLLAKAAQKYQRRSGPLGLVSWGVGTRFRAILWGVSRALPGKMHGEVGGKEGGRPPQQQHNKYRGCDLFICISGLAWRRRVNLCL